MICQWIRCSRIGNILIIETRGDAGVNTWDRQRKSRSSAKNHENLSHSHWHMRRINPSLAQPRRWCFTPRLTKVKVRSNIFYNIWYVLIRRLLPQPLLSVTLQPISTPRTWPSRNKSALPILMRSAPVEVHPLFNASTDRFMSFNSDFILFPHNYRRYRGTNRLQKIPGPARSIQSILKISVA
jgi:hypothetical protein